MLFTFRIFEQHELALKNEFIVQNRGGQTAAREPHATLRTFACGSLSFPKNDIFAFHIDCKVQKYCKMVGPTSQRAVQYYLCKSFQNELMMSLKRRLQTNSCFYVFMLRLFVTWVLRFAALASQSRFGHSWYRIYIFYHSRLLSNLRLS